MTIAEVGKKYHLTQDTIRYYERIGLIPEVPRTKNGIRNFDEESCRWIEFIKCMRDAGMEIEILLKYVTLFKQGEETVNERKKLLIEQRERLLEKQKKINETHTKYGDIKAKKVTNYGETYVYPEYESMKEIAQMKDIPLKELYKLEELK